MSRRIALFVRVHRGALQAEGAGITAEEAAAKIAERLSGEGPSKAGQPEPDSEGDRPRKNGEATRAKEPESEDPPADPLDIDDDPEPDADLLPDTDDSPDSDDDPEPDNRRDADDDLDPLDPEGSDDREEPDGPLNFRDVAEALEIDPAALADMEVPIKLQGKAGTATLKEVIQGYQRQEDYSSKTAALAKERSEFESTITQVKDGLSARLERFDLLATELEKRVLGDRELLTDELFENDPDKYRRIERDIKRNEELFNQAAQARVGSIREDLAENRGKVERKIGEEFGKLKDRHPRQFGDDGRAKKTMGRLQTFAEESYGISPAEFNGIESAAHVEVLMDAMRWRSLQKKKPAKRKQVANAPRMGRAGRAAEKGENQAAQRKRSLGKLRRSGNLRDAAKALSDLGIVR